MPIEAVSGKPILDIPPEIWGRYSPREWYSWRGEVEYMVIFAFGAWHWSIQSMVNPGDPIVSDYQANSERSGYPDEWAAMEACQRYVKRTQGE